MRALVVITHVLLATSCWSGEGLIVRRHSLPKDATYQSQSQWLIEPPITEDSSADWEAEPKEGGYTTIQIDRESSSVSIRSAACDTEGCNEIRAVAPHVMSALESSEGIRFTIEDALVIRPGYDRGIHSIAFVWGENRVLPTAEELDAAYGGGD